MTIHVKREHEGLIRHYEGVTSRLNDRVEINPDGMVGKPVIRGARIPIELLLRKLSEGATAEDLLDA